MYWRIHFKLIMINPFLHGRNRPLLNCISNRKSGTIIALPDVQSRLAEKLNIDRIFSHHGGILVRLIGDLHIGYFCAIPVQFHNYAYCALIAFCSVAVGLWSSSTSL